MVIGGSSVLKMKRNSALFSSSGTEVEALIACEFSSIFAQRSKAAQTLATHFSLPFGRWNRVSGSAAPVPTAPPAQRPTGRLGCGATFGLLLGEMELQNE